MLEANSSTAFPGKPCGSFPQIPFYCLQSKPLQESRALQNLTPQVETYLPLNASGRPLFTGYLFARIPLEKYVAARSTPGVMRIITLGGLPYEVPEDSMEWVRALAGANEADRLIRQLRSSELQVGSHVRITLGTYYGQTGKVERLTASKMIVLLDSLATFRCEMPKHWARLTQVIEKQRLTALY